MWLKKTTWQPLLFRLSNTGNIDFNFSARNDAKDSDNVSKRKIENSRYVSFLTDPLKPPPPHPLNCQNPLSVAKVFC